MLRGLMILPMFGLVGVMIVVGGLATLVACADPLHARLTPFVGFISLATGVGALSLSLFFLGIATITASTQTLSGVAFFAGYALGAISGGLFGLRIAMRRHKRFSSKAEASY